MTPSGQVKAFRCSKTPVEVERRHRKYARNKEVKRYKNN
jgi:hypothetical protein